MLRRLIPIYAKVVITVIWIVFIGNVAGTYLPHNPFTPSGSTKILIQSVFPQGWGFFTKDPQEPNFYIYSEEDENFFSVLKSPNSSYKNFFGLKRDARAQGAEYGMLLGKISKLRGADSVIWNTCKDKDHFECLSNMQEIRTVEITNSIKNPTLCGELLIITQKPIPWAWSSNPNTVNMPISFLKLNVQCNVESNK